MKRVSCNEVLAGRNLRYVASRNPPIPGPSTVAGVAHAARTDPLTGRRRLLPHAPVHTETHPLGGTVRHATYGFHVRHGPKGAARAWAAWWVICAAPFGPCRTWK